MKTELIWLLKVIALGAICFLSIEAGLLFRSVNKNLDGTVTKVNNILDTTDKTMLLTNKAVNDLRLTLDNVNKAAIDERKYSEVQLPQTLNGLNKVLDYAAVAEISANSLITNGSIAINTANTTIADLQPAILQLNDTAKSSTLVFNNMNSLVSDPDIKSSISNIDKITFNTSESTQVFTGILKDAKVEEDKFVYPKPQPWYKSILSTSLKVGELVYDFIR